MVSVQASSGSSFVSFRQLPRKKMTTDAPDFKEWPDEMQEILFVVHMKDMDDFEERMGRITKVLNDIPGVQLLLLNPNSVDYLDVRRLFDQ